MTSTGLDVGDGADYQDTEAAFNHAPRQLVEKWPAACRTRQGRYPGPSGTRMLRDTATDLTTPTGSVATVMTNSQAPPAGPSWRSIARLTAGNTDVQHLDRRHQPV